MWELEEASRFVDNEAATPLEESFFLSTRAREVVRVFRLAAGVARVCLVFVVVAVAACCVAVFTSIFRTLVQLPSRLGVGEGGGASWM